MNVLAKIGVDTTENESVCQEKANMLPNVSNFCNLVLACVFREVRKRAVPSFASAESAAGFAAGAEAAACLFVTVLVFQEVPAHVVFARTIFPSRNRGG